MHAYAGLCRDHYTPLDDTAIPTGEIAPVAGTPFDFTEAHSIRDAVGQVPGGIDHNYVLFGMGRQAKFIVKAGAASNTCAPTFFWHACMRACSRVRADVGASAPGCMPVMVLHCPPGAGLNWRRSCATPGPVAA